MRAEHHLLLDKRKREDISMDDLIPNPGHVCWS